MALGRFKLDTHDVSVFMSQPTTERQFAARSFAHNFLKSNKNTKTKNLYHKLLQMCLSDRDTSIQEEVSSRIFQSPNLPRDIAVQIVINKLASADWLLENYSLFEEQDLLAILLSGGCKEYEQIARRPDVTPLIFDYIAQYGCVDTVSDLIRNTSNILSVKGTQSIISRFADNHTVLKALYNRSDLPVEFTDQAHASDQTQVHVLMGRQPSPQTNLCSDINVREREQELVDKLSSNWSISRKRDASSQLFEDGRLTYSLLCRKLLDADVDFFIIGLSIKSKFPESSIRASVRNMDFIGLKEAFRKAGIPPHLQPAVKTVIKLLQNKGKLSGNQKLRLKHHALDEMKGIYHLSTSNSPEDLLAQLLPTTTPKKLN